MGLVKWLMVAAGAVALEFVVVPAQSAPVGVIGLADSASKPDVQQVHYRYRYYRYYGYPRFRYYRYSARLHYRRFPSHF